MNTNLLTIAAQLSDSELRAELKCLAQGARQKTVELIADLAVFASRKLHLAEGPGSLFGYCTEILRFSEVAACNRIKAAKAARKFPVILDLLTDGSVNLTTVRLLAPHLTAENHRALLEEAKGMTRRQVDKSVARLAPKPDVPSSIRRLPAPVPSAQPESVVMATTKPTSPTPAAHRSVVAPLSPERYRLQLTVGEDTHDDLRCLQDLLRREIADGDPAAIVARALKLLRREVEKRTFAATPTPRPGRTPKPGSRDIPADVQRKGWRRDAGQCAFVAPLHGAQLHRVPPRRALCIGWRGDGGEHRAPLPRPQRLRVRADLRPLRPVPCARDAGGVRHLDRATSWSRDQ
jgi:hypothetical protein